MNTIDTSDLIGTAELAKLKGAKRKTATDWCADGLIPARKLGRDWYVTRADALAFEPRPVGRPKILETANP